MANAFRTSRALSTRDDNRLLGLFDRTRSSGAPAAYDADVEHESIWNQKSQNSGQSMRPDTLFISSSQTLSELQPLMSKVASTTRIVTSRPSLSVPAAPSINAAPNSAPTTSDPSVTVKSFPTQHPFMWPAPSVSPRPSFPTGSSRAPFISDGLSLTPSPVSFISSTSFPSVNRTRPSNSTATITPNASQMPTMSGHPSRFPSASPAPTITPMPSLSKDPSISPSDSSIPSNSPARTVKPSPSSPRPSLSTGLDVEPSKSLPPFTSGPFESPVPSLVPNVSAPVLPNSTSPLPNITNSPSMYGLSNTSAPSTNAPSPTAPAPTPSSSSSGLGVAAIAGIVVGVALLLYAVIYILSQWYMRSIAASSQQTSAAAAAAVAAARTVELENDSASSEVEADSASSAVSSSIYSA